MSSSPDLRHNLKRISPYTVELGEGPHYDEKTGRLYHVDLIKGGCYYLDTKTLEYESIYFEPGLTLIVPIEGKADHFVISKNRSLYTLDWANKNCCDLITTVDEGKDTRVNDGKCDPSGRLWFGTMNWERKPGIFTNGLGSLYSINHNKQVSLHQNNITISNGLAWSSDRTKFYFIDSMARQVWVYDYDDKSGNISNRRTAFDYKDHSDFICREVPDGMTIDLHDKLWVTSFNGKKVTRIDPETGKVLGIIKTPASKTTSATWGGPDFRTLYLTSATFGASQEELQAEPDAGAIFSVTFEQENIRGSINQEVKFHS